MELEEHLRPTSFFSCPAISQATSYRILVRAMLDFPRALPALELYACACAHTLQRSRRGRGWLAWGGAGEGPGGYVITPLLSHDQN